MYNKENVSLLIQNGIDGFEHLEYTNGFTFTKDAITKKSEDKFTMEELDKLLDPSNNNRTLVNTCLQKFHYHTSIIEHIENDMEKVNFGELSWDSFCLLYKSRIHDCCSD